MANLVTMNMKRKEHAEVAGLSMFLDPKRLKLQDGEIPDMMEEEKPSAGVQPDPTVPTMALSWLLPIQGQELHDTMNTAYEMSSSETPPFRPDQAVAAAGAAPMDVEVQLRQRQPQAPPCQQAPFWSGFF